MVGLARWRVRGVVIGLFVGIWEVCLYGGGIW